MVDKSVNNIYTDGVAKKHEDPVMAKVRKLFEDSGLSLHDLGIKMECTPETARQAVWQFMRTADPHLSVLRRFAKAMETTVQELVNPVSNGLRLVLIPLRELLPKQKDGKRKNNIRKIQECVDPVLERSRSFQKAYPEYFPESKHLAPYFAALEECRSLPTESEGDKRTFVAKADECLNQLRVEIEKMLQQSG